MERICDFHGHFLPGMDDGCKSVEESVQVLQSSYRQGITRVCATSHYYPVEPVEAFLQRREEAVNMLNDHIRQNAMEQIPQILLGAEVAYRPGIGQQENLEKLCLGSSRYLLLEMPFTRWGKAEVREIGKLCANKGVTPILAHIERYWEHQDPRVLRDILQQDVLVQLNAQTLLQRPERRLARRLLKSGAVQLLGTDCHNMVGRAPRLGEALTWLQKKMPQALETIAYFSSQVCAEAAQE